MARGGANATRNKVLEFVKSFMAEKGYSPSVGDIVAGCSLSSPNLAQYHLNVLEREGLLRRTPGVFRSIQIVRMTNREVPLLGVIAAGAPIPVPESGNWVDSAEEMLELSRELVGDGGNLFALKVRGRSMIDACVMDGDIVVMEAAQSAVDGDMVAVWLKDEHEVTLKRIYREKGHIRLQPANRQMEPLYVDPDNVAIQGRVVAVIRKYTR
ncbi:MAG: repressor LexA [Dehalococcoidia bacterium]|nr:repressor LexA [Dehalococcoidia bacterium]